MNALSQGGEVLLVHSRSIHDDDRGLEYKDIGAKTADLYRVTLLRRRSETAP